MTIEINLNYDDPDNEFYACNCGAVSKLAEELKYRVQDKNGVDHIITGLEVMEYDYWNEADNFEFWSDCVDIDTDDMTKDEIKEEILNLLPDVMPKMSYDKEVDFIKSI